MPFQQGETVEVIGGASKGKTGVISAVLPSSRYTVRLNTNPATSPSIAEKDLQRPKWDHKHGLVPKTAGFTATGGALAGGASLANKKVLERVAELFGKASDTRGRRLSGLPTHVAALNNELNPPANPGQRATYNTDRDQYLTVEKNALKKLDEAAALVAIDFPPIAVIFPLLGRVVILRRKNNVAGREEDYFSIESLAATRGEYVMDGNTLGTYYHTLPAYANRAAYSVLGGTWVRQLMEAGLADGY